MKTSTRVCLSPVAFFLGQPSPRLYGRGVEIPRARHYEYRFEEAYAQSIHRLILFDAGAHSRETGKGQVNSFPTHLAVKDDVAVSTRDPSADGRSQDRNPALTPSARIGYPEGGAGGRPSGWKRERRDYPG